MCIYIYIYTHTHNLVVIYIYIYIYHLFMYILIYWCAMAGVSSSMPSLAWSVCQKHVHKSAEGDKRWGHLGQRSLLCIPDLGSSSLPEGQEGRHGRKKSRAQMCMASFRKFLGKMGPAPGRFELSKGILKGREAHPSRRSTTRHARVSKYTYSFLYVILTLSIMHILCAIQ